MGSAGWLRGEGPGEMGPQGYLWSFSGGIQDQEGGIQCLSQGDDGPGVVESPRIVWSRRETHQLMIGTNLPSISTNLMRVDKEVKLMGLGEGE